MRFQIYWSFFLLLFIVSCKYEAGNRILFKERISIQATGLNFDSVYLDYPYRISLDSNRIFVTDLHATDFFVHEFEYPSIKYSKSFAPRGNGPLELLSVGNIINSRGKFYLLDVFSKKIFNWDGSQTTLYAQLEDSLGICNDFTLYDDSLFIVPDFTGENRFAFVGTNGTCVKKMGTIPAKEHVSVPKPALARAWTAFLHYNPNNNILALVTQLGDVLQIYNLSTNESYVKIGPEGEPRFSMRGARAVPDGIMGYGSVFVGDKHIYAIYWGHSFEDISKGIVNEEGGRFLRVFDLQGNPVIEYQLDCFITGFCINETTKEVIATDVNNERLVSFKLNN